MDMKRSTLTLILVLLLATRLAAQTSLIAFGSTWKYLDNGSDQGTAWQGPSFDDAGWNSGYGLFGYGTGEEATVINYGHHAKRKYTTTYFRKTLTIADPAAFTSYTAKLKRDDGVVVYINGQEVYRDNLPKGPIHYKTLAASAKDYGYELQTFTLPGTAFSSGNNLIAVEVHQTSLKSFDMGFDLEVIGHAPVDQQPPTVLSINRQSPLTEATTATTVIFRLTFSEPVTGVDSADFQLAAAGSASGELATVAPSGTDGKIYDITIQAIAGQGTLGLNLPATGTSIADAAGNALAGGFTGQTFIIEQVPAREGFATITPLHPLPAIYDATKGKQQAKVFTHAGRHWSIFADQTGTHLWRLDDTRWTQMLTLTHKEARADCITDGNVTHILLFRGRHSELVSVEYVPEGITYQPWSLRNTKVDIELDDGVETASITRDGTGRLWLATDAVTDINVRWSEAPYTHWSAPITVASGVDDDDVGALIYMPAARQTGLLWGNQVTERFGFRTHADGAAPAAWSADEVPASQSALNIGKGMADDHLNMKVAGDGTLYCAVKTGYDEIGYPKIVLLVRRPDGTWDHAYEVSQKGTAPIVILNEALGKIRVIYSSQTYGGDILYKESSTANIAFGTEFTLIREVNNYATSSHQNFTSEVVILASNSRHTVGVLASDVPTTSPVPDSTGLPDVVVLPDSTAQADSTSTSPGAGSAAGKADPAYQPLQAYPNPFSSKLTIRFTLSADGEYTLNLYDHQQVQLVYQQQGAAQAGELNTLEVDGSQLAPGLYLAQLHADGNIQSLRLVLDR